MSQSKARNIVGWVLQILLGGLFLMSGVGKLMGEAEVAANFERWGYPAWFLMVTGVLELLGALGLFIPMTARWAASGLALLMLGAAWTHISGNDGLMVLMPLLILALLVVVAYLRWPLRRQG